MTPAEKIARVAALTELGHAFALAQIRRLHPDEDERVHRLRLVARWVDPATMRAAFGWPSAEGEASWRILQEPSPR